MKDLRKIIEETLEKLEKEQLPTHFQMSFHCKTYGFTTWEGKIGDRICADPKCFWCASFDEAMKDYTKTQKL